MRRLPLPTPDQQGDLLALWAFIFGSWVRLFPAAIADFPINDGGLFYQMIIALQENRLRLPAAVHFNGLEIPFVYPPLGFYIAAGIASALHLPALTLLRWLPAVFSVCTLFAFHKLAVVVLPSRLQAGLASLLFAFTPRAITWLVMGGGLTRSLGQLFLILTIVNVYRLFWIGRKYLGAAILFGGLTVLSHPEAAIHAAAMGLLLWAFKGRTRPGQISALWTGAGVAGLTSIWWIGALSRHGIAPFLSALQTGAQTELPLFYALQMTFSEEPLMNLVMVLALLGFAVHVARREYLLPSLLVLPFLVEARAAPTVATIPLALLASTGLADLILPGLTQIEAGARTVDRANSLHSRAARGLLFFCVLYLMGAMFLFGTRIAGTRVSADNRAAFDWVRKNSSPGAKFLVLTYESAPFCDGIQEWFPALTERTSLGTTQGREWLDGSDFGSNMALRMQVQHCDAAASPAACAEQWARDLGADFDYVYALRFAEFKPQCAAHGLQRNEEHVIVEFRRAGEYAEVFSSSEVVIFARRPILGSEGGE